MQSRDQPSIHSDASRSRIASRFISLYSAFKMDSEAIGRANSSITSLIVRPLAAVWRLLVALIANIDGDLM